MTPYWLLLPLFALNAVGSWLTYSDSLRKSDLYSPAMVGIGGLVCALFTLGAVRSVTTEAVFIFSLFADVVMFFCYYVLPLLLFGVRPSFGVLAGSALVVAGLVLVKVYEC